MREYKMVQIPREVGQAPSRKHRTGNEAADYLESLANEMAAEGWAFEGLEAMSIVTPPGCLGFGQPEVRPVYVAKFSRQAGV